MGTQFQADVTRNPYEREKFSKHEIRPLAKPAFRRQMGYFSHQLNAIGMLDKKSLATHVRDGNRFIRKEAELPLHHSVEK